MNSINTPLTKILLKIFSNGFYRAHGGIIFFFCLIIFGVGEPKQIFKFHKALMLFFITKPLIMIIVFLIVILFAFKCWHYVSGRLFSLDSQFLFYSSNVYEKHQQFCSWAVLQSILMLPIILYGLACIIIAVIYQYYFQAVIILCYIIALVSVSSLFFMGVIDKLIEGKQQSILLRLTKGWRKPFFSFYIYHVLDTLKLKFFILKILSYLIIIALFSMFADVSHDFRIGGIIMLSIGIAHSSLVFEERRFEETFMSFSRNIPLTKLKIITTFIGVYFFLLFPEAVWLFCRFSPMNAVVLLIFCLSLILFLHTILYFIGSNIEKYSTWLFLIFVILFWFILFKALWVLIFLNFLISYVFLKRNYYKTMQW